MRLLACAALLTFTSMSFVALGKPLSESETKIRVMSFNIRGLPWPIAKNREGRLLTIADKLAEMRKAGTAPQILVLQEAFGGPIDQIAKRGGYAHVVKGPSANLCSREEAARFKDPTKCRVSRIFDAGLYVMSDFPIAASARAAFGNGQHCTGWDCKSNKGGLYAMIKVPTMKEPIHVYTTHMNSNGASGSSYDKVVRAQRLQLLTLKRLLDETQSATPAGPIVFAGDFNVKAEQPTYPDLVSAMNMPNAGLVCVANIPTCQIPASTIPSELFERVDHHFFGPSAGHDVFPTFAAHSLTRATDGHDYSDHPAFTVEYSFKPLKPNGAVASRARIH